MNECRYNSTLDIRRQLIKNEKGYNQPTFIGTHEEKWL
jgi:hypothetical protein